jgi:spore germination protein GerM
VRHAAGTALGFASLAALGGSLAVLVSGCGSSGAVSLGPPPTVRSTSLPEPPATTTARPRRTVSLEVWFARRGRLAEVTRRHPATPRVATAAVRALLAGPTPDERAAGIATAIPADTRLLGISIARGVATVDLTSEYQSGGGSLSMEVRLGQVVYTLTQFPTVRGVRFELDGAPVNVFSSEGIVLDHPVGRADYRDLRPATSGG